MRSSGARAAAFVSLFNGESRAYNDEQETRCRDDNAITIPLDDNESFLLTEEHARATRNFFFEYNSRGLGNYKSEDLAAAVSNIDEFSEE